MTTHPQTSHPAPYPSSGSGTELWLARHGEVHGDWQGRAYGDLDVPLSNAGELQTERLARSLAALRPDVVVTSPLQRARSLGERTAREAQLELEVTPELREIHRGRWQGLGVKELHERKAAAVRSFYEDPWRFDAHGGESDEALLQRMEPALRRLLTEHAGKRIVITTHYNVVRVFTAAALGVPPARSFALRIDTAHTALLVDEAHGWTLRHANVAAPADALESVRTRASDR